MDLKELKDIWTQYDRKLDNNLRINEELLRKTNLDKTKRELQKPFYYEVMSVIICGFSTLLVGFWCVQYLNEIKYSIPGILSVLILGQYFRMSLDKTRLMGRIEYYIAPAIQVQKSITNLTVQILKYRKIELILMPFLIVTVLPILFKAIHDVDLYERWWLFVIELVIILGISLPLAFWINKHLFDKKLKNAKAFMEDIRKFEIEEE